MSDQLDNQASNNRPHSPELLGVSELQAKRQGKPRKEEREPLPPESGGWAFQTFLGLASLVLMILGIIALAAWGWTALNTEKSTPAPAIVPPSFIYTEITREIEVATSTDVAGRVEQFREIVDIRPGGFAQFYFTHTRDEQLRLMTPRAFFARLTLRSDALPVLDYAGDTFMYGQYALGSGQEGSYLILPIANYDSAYGSLLQSETRLTTALGPLGFSPASDFADTIVENKDVRFATTTDGTGIYWSFPQPDRLVITTNEATLRAVFTRLEQARRSQAN